jgi:hypothetical protein
MKTVGAVALGAVLGAVAVAVIMWAVAVSQQVAQNTEKLELIMLVAKPLPGPGVF